MCCWFCEGDVDIMFGVCGGKSWYLGVVRWRRWEKV